jgi:hypothetical protein
MGDALRLELNTTGSTHFFNQASNIKPSSINPPLSTCCHPVVNDTNPYMGQTIIILVPPTVTFVGCDETIGVTVRCTTSADQ